MFRLENEYARYSVRRSWYRKKNKNLLNIYIKIGDWKEPIVCGKNVIELSPDICFKYDKTENSIEWVYNDFENNNLKSDYLIKRSILCTTNRNVDSINKQILTKLSDETSISYSTNTPVNEG